MRIMFALALIVALIGFAPVCLWAGGTVVVTPEQAAALKAAGTSPQAVVDAAAERLAPLPARKHEAVALFKRLLRVSDADFAKAQQLINAMPLAPEPVPQR